MTAAQARCNLPLLRPPQGMHCPVCRPCAPRASYLQPHSLVFTSATSPCLQLADLSDALGPDFNGTLFAPTDAAFGKLLAALGPSFNIAALTEENVAALKDILVGTIGGSWQGVCQGSS